MFGLHDTVLSTRLLLKSVRVTKRPESLSSAFRTVTSSLVQNRFPSSFEVLKFKLSSARSTGVKYGLNSIFPEFGPLNLQMDLSI